MRVPRIDVNITSHLVLLLLHNVLLNLMFNLACCYEYTSWFGQHLKLNVQRCPLQAQSSLQRKIKLVSSHLGL